jgi:hypothetical protein
MHFDPDKPSRWRAFAKLLGAALLGGAGALWRLAVPLVVLALVAVGALVVFGQDSSAARQQCAQARSFDRYALYEQGIRLHPSVPTSPPAAQHRYCIGTIGWERSTFRFAQGDEVKSRCFETSSQALQAMRKLSAQQQVGLKDCAAAAPADSLSGRLEILTPVNLGKAALAVVARVRQLAQAR